MFELVEISRRLERLLEVIARISGWLLPITAAVICFDVVSRKLGYQLPGMGSTRLQELEWHFAAILFLMWIGYGVMRNTHVRIDVFTAHLSRGTRDRIDLFGTIFLALPYALILLPYAYWFFETSLLQMERSDAPNGLPARFIIKGFLFLGFVLIVISAIALLLRKIVDVFGPRELHSAERAGREVET